MKLTKEQVKEVINSVYGVITENPNEVDMAFSKAFFDLGAKLEREAIEKELTRLSALEDGNYIMAIRARSE